eukprot:c11061_g1_i3.p1 GENE.c11061_g1_i3~~c11061_g1_i3.p1  ORF type:complete len:1007 (-),score=267.88 c11061_g1_i3:703-3723(-)
MKGKMMRRVSTMLSMNTFARKSDFSSSSDEDDDLVAKRKELLQGISKSSKGRFCGSCRGKSGLQKKLERELQEFQTQKAERASMVWSMAAVSGAPPSGRRGHSANVVGDELLVFGGLDHTGKLSDSLFVLDIKTLTWKSDVAARGQVPTPRSHHSATVLIEGTILIFGGRSAGSEVHIFEPETRTFFIAETATGGAPPRYGHAASASGTSVFVLGGIGLTTGSALADFWELDTSDMSWHQHNLPEDFDQRMEINPSPVLVTVDNTLLLTGLSMNPRSFAVVYTGQIEQSEIRWKTLRVDRDPPRPRISASYTATSRHLYVIGGQLVENSARTNEVLVFDYWRGQWRTSRVLGSAPPGRSDHTATLIEGNPSSGRPHDDPDAELDRAVDIMCFGGYDGKQVLGDARLLVAMTWRIQKCDLKVRHEGVNVDVAGLIAPPQGLLVPRIGHTMTALGTRIYVIGGVYDDKPFNDVIVYDTLENRWFSSAPSGTLPPFGLVAHTAVVVQSEIFVFGGGDGRHDAHEMFVFDTEMWTWETAKFSGECPKARYGHSACVRGEQMFVFGGYSLKSGYSNDLSVLDTSSLEWIIPYVSGERPAERVGHSMIVVGNKVFVYGGSNRDTQYNDMYVLDVTNIMSLRWTSPQLARSHDQHPRYMHTATAIGGKIFIFGGASNIVHYVKKKTVPNPPAVPLTWRQAGTRYAMDMLSVFDCAEVATNPDATVSASNALGSVAGLRGWVKVRYGAVAPPPRFRHAAAVVGTRIYMWGGQGSDAQMWILETGHAQPTAETNVVASTNTTAASQKEEQDADITVMGWLVKLGVERYKRAFIRAEIDWISLLELTDNDLKLMGVHQLGPRKKILMAIDSLRSAHRKTLSVADDLFQRRYRVGREIVFGGVPCKRAVDITTDGPVVLKFIPDVVAFRREVAALNELRSEFVADLLEFYEDPLGGRSCLVLEYSQFSLDRLFEKRRLQPNERKALFERCQITRAANFSEQVNNHDDPFTHHGAHVT